MYFRRPHTGPLKRRPPSGDLFVLLLSRSEDTLRLTPGSMYPNTMYCLLVRQYPSKVYSHTLHGVRETGPLFRSSLARGSKTEPSGSGASSQNG